MNTKTKSNLYAGTAFITLLIAGYAFLKTVEYWETLRDLLGTAMLGGTALVLTLVAGVHLATAFAYRFGCVNSVIGRRDRATLKGEEGNIVIDVNISYVAEPDPAELASNPTQCLIFFIAAGRPWVCPADKFLV